MNVDFHRCMERYRCICGICTCVNKINLKSYMQEGNDKYLFKELSFLIVGIAYEVFNELGHGYQEKYYQRAMATLMQKRGISFRQQVQHDIIVQEKVIGRYYFDFLINEKIVVEIKKGGYFNLGNIEQTNAYLKRSKLQLAILINFTPSGVIFKRILNIN